jgi:hypothetical protein
VVSNPPEAALPARIQFALQLFAAGLLLVGCSGTDGTLGDSPSRPKADEFGNGATLAEVIGPAPWLNPKNTDSVNCGSPVDSNVFVTGVTVNAIDTYDETGSGSVGNYYVQDSLNPGAYAGVNVFAPTFTPPDLRLAAGDVTDILGVFSEFKGPSTFLFTDCKTLPEIRGTMSFRFENGPLVPKTIPLADLKSYQTARQWLGMLVRVENVTLNQSSTDSKNRLSAQINVGGGVSATDVPTITNELYDIGGEGPSIGDGMKFKAISGVVTFFVNFHIAPRSKADFEQ